MKTLDQIISEIRELNLPDSLTDFLISSFTCRFSLMDHNTVQSTAITARMYIMHQYKDKLDPTKMYKVTNLILDFANLK